MDEDLTHLLRHTHTHTHTHTYTHSPEHLEAPPSHGSEEPWPQVTGRVNGIAAVEAHGHADGEDGQADDQRLHAFRCSDVLLVGDCQDTQDQRRSTNHLGGRGILPVVLYIHTNTHTHTHTHTHTYTSLMPVSTQAKLQSLIAHMKTIKSPIKAVDGRVNRLLPW